MSEDFFVTEIIAKKKLIRVENKERKSKTLHLLIGNTPEKK